MKYLKIKLDWRETIIIPVSDAEYPVVLSVLANARKCNDRDGVYTAKEGDEGELDVVLVSASKVKMTEDVNGALARLKEMEKEKQKYFMESYTKDKTITELKNQVEALQNVQITVQDHSIDSDVVLIEEEDNV